MSSIDNEATNEVAPIIEVEPPAQRRSSRETRPLERMKDFFIYHTVSYPMINYLMYNNVNSNPVWKNVMEEELHALDKNKTCDIVRLPPRKKTVGCHWVYKTKYKSDGTVERHKARLVARGFTQTYGVDYKETFALIAKMNTFWVLISLAVNQDWKLYQMDVKNAFLYGDLEEEVYMSTPLGYPEESKFSLVYRLKKAIYELKQSPRAWYAKRSILLINGLKRSVANPSLFAKKCMSGTTIVLVYIDDIVITGDDQDEISRLKTCLHNRFAIKDLGILKYFLGLEIAYS